MTDVARKEPPPTGNGIEVIEVVSNEIGFIIDDPELCKQVLADFVARADFGYKKYGTRLRVNNGRNAVMDAHQEGIDLAMYLRQESLQQVGTPLAAAYERLYKAAVKIVSFTREHLNHQAKEK